ncbi:hypothetical protein BGW80DRAFT_1263804 [Lactifluus volemus]|nr:hypothetical protein BGW80DRAFT_1263804 [Lactifluus volemus]
MIHHVARSTILHHSQFQNIFQEAAARAYLRVQTHHLPVDVFCAQPTTGTGTCAILPVPVFSNASSFNPKTYSKKCLPQKPQRLQSPHNPLSDTTHGASPTHSQVDPLVSPVSLSRDLRDNLHPSVIVSSTHGRKDSLTRRLRHFYLSSPRASIQSLVSYHNLSSDAQSTQSYNFLLQLAIRHSAFGTAHTLLQSMRASRVPEDVTTWQLYVRLLVREGRWSDAWHVVIDPPKNPSRAPFASDGVPVQVWGELLGTAKRRAFRGTTQIRDPGMNSLERYRQVMFQLPKLGVSSRDTPPPRVVYASVAALLQMQQRGDAEQVTTQFLAMDPKGMATFYRALRDLQGFCVVCPELKPNSTTLFLLLGHLKGVKHCGMIGHKLVRWFRRRWGNSVVSPRVERRMLALAVKEKRVNLIRRWLTCIKIRRKIRWMWNLEREVVDGWKSKRPSLTEYPDLRPASAGTVQFSRLLRRASKMSCRRDVLDVESDDSIE